MKPKIVFLDSKTLGNLPELEKINALGEVSSYASTQPSERLERLKDAEIAITNKVVLDRELIDHLPALKMICVAATGTNNIDVRYAESKGIVVKNAVGYSTDSVAQLTFALVLGLANRINYFDDYVKSGAYAQSDIFTHIGDSFSEIGAKTFGIVGLGNIGTKVAGIAQAFGAEVIYFSTTGKNQNQDFRQVGFEELLAESDIVSLHCPLTPQTKHLIGEEELEKMKSTALLINTARGPVVGELALAKALENNEIAGAGIDVFAQEPVKPDNPLLKIRNKSKLLLTPHIAWTSLQARRRLIAQIVENIQEFLKK